ncbi:MAG: hypothetical protein ACRD9R_10255 [Pyrinomonadaceae bacterium]
MERQSSIHVPYRDERDIETVVRRFEACDFAPTEFTHGAHLTVALWYLARLPSEAAAGRMREGLRRFLAHHGLATGYHETITLFWLKLVRRFLDGQADGRALTDITNEMLATCSDSKLLFEYYSRELVQSERAVSEWIEPDLKSLKDAWG